jgi:hypothetical protein
MSELSETPTVSFTLSSQILRVLFVAGFALNAALTFVPTLKNESGGFMGLGSEKQSLSGFDIVRMTFQHGQGGLGVFYVLVFCIPVAFAVLGITYPRRWVFITGSCFTVFLLLLNLFAGSAEGVEYYFLPRLLGYLSFAMTLTGFWVKTSTKMSTK